MPLFAYSIRSILALMGGFAVLYMWGLAWYALAGQLSVYQIPVAVLAAYFIWGFYYYWRRPLRRARFLDDHFELSGWNVRIRSSYGDIESLRKVKVRFFSDTAVLLSVRGSPLTFRIPNKKNRTLKLDLYSWLLQKSQLQTAPMG